MTLDGLLQQPEEEFNLGEAAPQLNDDFDIQQCSAKIEKMADELRPRISGTCSEETICEINKYLFEEQGFVYNSNFFLNKVLDEKKGSCVGLSILYLALAERLNLPIHGVSLPEHMMIRWDDRKFKRNIEVVDKGEWVTNIHSQQWRAIPQESIEKGVYLKNISKKGVIGIQLLIRGKTYLDNGDFNSAIQDYNKALEINPNYAEAHHGLGRAYEEKREFDSAIAEYNKVLEINPNSADIYLNRGNVYEKKGDFDAAIAEYNKVLEINPNHTNAYYGLGDVYEKKGDFDRAIQDFSKALEIDPNYTEAYYGRGRAYEEKREFDSAIVEYNKVLEINPNYANAYLARGNVYHDKGEFDSAITDYNKFLEINPNYADASKVLEVIKDSEKKKAK
jgi:tetratricopeptide (TPR) repeat protein